MSPVQEQWRGGRVPASVAVARVLGVVMAAILVTGTALNAQNAPNALGQPLLDASGNVRDDAFIEIPLRADDQQYSGRPVD